MSTECIRFQNVHFSYKKNHPILQDLSFQINEGEFVAILGPSGSGKSTIFRLITGLEKWEIGKIICKGATGLMPQQDLLLPWRTVIENGALPLEVKGLHKRKAQAFVKEKLASFGLDKVGNSYPHELSGGMRQRVSFLRATITGHDIFLLDEPFSALDSMTRIKMQNWLLKMWGQESSTILFITHDVDEAIRMADRILLFTEAPLNTYLNIPIRLGRPRSSEVMAEPEAIMIRKKIYDLLGLGGAQ